MIIKSLELTQMRVFKQKDVDFNKRATVLVGPNGSGKTNVLEAVYLLATGTSFRATKDEQLISNGDELTRVTGQTEQDKLEIVITRGKINGKRVPRKRYLINGVSKKKSNFVGKLKVVLFRPENIELVLGSPSVRRDYLDSVLEQVNWQYRRASLSYAKGLRQRNQVLKQIKEGEAKRSQLTFWNKLLIKNGDFIHQKRADFISFVNRFLESENYQLVYDHSGISEARLVKYKDAEVGAGVTLVGPHRDDVIFEFKKPEFEKPRDLSLYGSRGEQRLGVLNLKLAEIDFIVEKTSQKPVLILDDIFSELDESNRELVAKLISGQQTILTTTDLDLAKDVVEGKVIKLKRPNEFKKD